MEEDKKATKLLIKFLIYILAMLLIVIIGSTNVLALENNNVITFYDNNGSSLTSLTTDYIQQTGESNAIFTTTANSYGGAVMVQLGTPLVKDHLYTLFVNVGAYSNGGYTELSTKNCIGLGTTYNNAINSYVNCSITPNYSQKSGVTSDKGRGLYFSFIADKNAPYILIPYTTQYTCNNCMQYSFGYEINDAGNTTGLTQTEVNNLINNQTTIIENQITGMQNSITGAVEDMSGSLTNTIEDNLNSCHTSKNLFNAMLLNGVNGIEVKDKGELIKMPLYESGNGFTSTGKKLSELAPDLRVGDQVILFAYTTSGINNFIYVGSTSWYFNQINSPKTITQEMLNATVILYGNRASSGETTQVIISKMSFVKYEDRNQENWEPYGEVCKNKLDEQNETSKGILGKLGDLLDYFNPTSDNWFVKKLVDLLVDGLKSLFIPSNNFFSNWYAEFKTYMETKLGFLTAPFTFIIDLLEAYRDLGTQDPIIHIPNITVPNFESNVIIEAQDYNWKTLLESKQEFNTLWTLYLDFIDVFLILNFLGLCENTFNRIFGGDTQYEYYTTEEQYDINDNTGEATNHKLRQRKTRREKVK